MLKQKEVEEIKKLIESGFDLELISFELDVPIEQVRQCKLDMENSKNNSTTRTIYSARDIIDKKNNQAHSKISQMREKYRQLYFRSNKVEVIRPKPLSQQEMELIRTVIATVQETIEKMKTLPKKEKRRIASSILPELKKIEEYQLPMAEAEQLYGLMCSSELQGLNSNVTDRIDYYMKKQKSRSANQFAKAVEYEHYDVDDIEELQRLDRKITGTMVSENPISVGAVKTKISSKITAIRQQQAIDRIRNDIPISIISVISNLASGNIDMQKANAIIDEEAKRRVESKPKTRFSLTEEQERRQILIQIRTAITEKADKFHIQNPERAVLQIQELCGGELGQSIRAVVKNLTAKKDYEAAKSICDKFSRQSKDEETESEHTKYIRGLRNEIRNAEISDIVMTAINMNGTPEEERAYFELIEKGLRMGNVRLSAISLGKSKDGVKSITLADIWKDKIEKGKSRY